MFTILRVKNFGSKLFGILLADDEDDGGFEADMSGNLRKRMIKVFSPERDIEKTWALDSLGRYDFIIDFAAA
jgi:hypothetical protein